VSTPLEVALPWCEELRIPGSPERDAFLVSYAPLVRYVAQRLAARLPGSVHLEDMVGDGLLGLIDAVDRFDPDRGVQFKTYAERRIRGGILDGLRGRDWAPRAMRRAGRRLEEAVAAAEQRLGRTAEEEDIATELGISLAELQDLYQRAKGLRLSHLPGPGEEGVDPADSAADPLEHLTERERRERLAKEIERLPERERFVLGLYYEKGLTLKEIGKVFSITESRVCQIHTRAVARLTARLRPAERAERAGSEVVR
jgi:RNA polymerase sigma factor for flagellar operon FliA